MQVELDLLDPTEQRIAPRRDTRLRAGVRRGGSSRIPAVITDLSTTGFRLESDERLPRDAVVWITIASLAPLQARVVWSSGFLAGCAFSTPLHPAVLDHIAVANGS